MRIFSLKQEDYPAIADFISVSFERDLAEFTEVYKTMNAEYLEKFKKAITELKNHDSAAGIFVKQKETTAKMYKLSDDMKHNIVLLKDYCARSGVNTSIISNMVQKINGKNIEGIIKSMRDALPYFVDNASKIADMPDGFLEKIIAQTKELDVLNVEQNKLMNERKLSTSESKKLYESDTLKWITKYLKDNNYTITQVASQLLVSFLGIDLGRIANELNKLKIILPKGTEITPSHIEENIGISKDFNVFELQNAIGKKEFPKAMQIIKYFNENQKDNAMPMITENLYQYFKKLFIYSSSIGKADAELAREMGINPFFLKDYKVAAMNYPLKKISFCMEVIKQTDLKSKGVESGSISYYDLLKELIVKIIF